MGSNPTPSAMTPPAISDHDAMGVALDEARRAADAGDVPVGAVVLDASGSVVAATGNARERLADPTAHAEILALRAAASARGTWHLDDCTLVVTLEPCPMCAGAAINARIGRIVFGAADPKAGATGSLYHLASDPRLNHNPPVVHGVRAAECAALLTEFFAARRS